MAENSSKIVVFDVCGTLYTSNTTYDFLLFYFKKYRKNKYYKCRFLLSLPSKILLVALAKLGIKIGLRGYLVSLLANEPVEAVREAAKIFTVKFLASKEIDTTQNYLKQLIKRGERVVLASGSLYPVVQEIANELQVDNFIASTLEEDGNSKYTGKYLLDVKAKKLEFLDYRSSEMIIVTDNLDDLSLIDNAGEAIIVSKRQNIGNWNKLLKTHPNFRIEPV